MTKKQLRGLAKTGMTASLAALVLTGMHPGRGNRTAHTWAGIALVGFTVWHHNLYAVKAPGRAPKASLRADRHAPAAEKRQP